MSSMDRGDSDEADDARFQSSSSRACDNCRLRKIRCDKKSPCSSCRVNNTTCRTTTQRPPPKQRVLISSQYEKKIDRIEDRLSGIERLLRQLALNPTNVQPKQDEPPSPDEERPLRGSPGRLISEMADTDGAYGGETTFNQDSVFASELLENAVNANILPTRGGEINAALSSLKNIVKQKSQIKTQDTRAPLKGGSNRNALRDSKLPPFDFTKAALDKMNDESMQDLTAIFSFMSIAKFTELVQELYEDRESCTAGRAMFVNGVLYYLFQGCKSLEADKNSEFARKCKEYSVLTRNNLEVFICGLELLMPATLENVGALLMGALYAVDVSKPSLCWTLTSTAVALCQTLGYHNLSTMTNDSEDERNSKMYAFWILYSLDKSLSLRLGRASTVQDYDISIPFPIPNPTARGREAMDKTMYCWIKLASLQGQVYEHLYSPGAFNKGQDSRIQAAHRLARELEEVTEIRKSVNISEIYPDPEKLEYHEIIHSSDTVIHLSVRTLILRAIPPGPEDISTTFTKNCIETARRALIVHNRSCDMISKKDEELYFVYIHWSILQAPFAPFMVIFCHVISVYDLSDLKLLEAFVTSIERTKHVSSGAEKLYRICHVFTSVAKLYVEAQMQALSSGQENSDLEMPLIEEFDPFLNALGMGPNNAPFSTSPLVSSGYASAGPGATSGDEHWGHGDFGTDLTNQRAWYEGNQHIMNLMEEDVSFLPSNG